MDKPKIFLWCVPFPAMRPGDVIGYALAEDGTGLANHLSSDDWLSRHDMGLHSTLKHDAYKEHYPDGYELVWFDDPESNDEWQKAFAFNQEDEASDTK